MSYIPDCRSDEYYNQKYLTGNDKEFIRGFDWCVEMAADNFFDNIDTVFGTDDHLIHVLNEKVPESMQEEWEFESFFPDAEKRVMKVETYADLLRKELAEWIESHRDELITSMLDHMDEETYKAVKAKVDAEASEG